MSRENVRALAPGYEAKAIHTVVLAFAADPVARWSWPDSQLYLESMPSLTKAFGGAAYSSGGAHATEAFSGVALWLPPGIAPDEDGLSEVIAQTVPSSTRNDVFAVFEEMAKYHPHEPHWYLPLIGVDPAHQGKGYGHSHDICASAV